METNRLLQLQVLAQTESLTQAATVLGITVGALSKSLGVLSEQLGYPLYVGVGRGLKLTEQARAVIPQIDGILNSLRELQNSSRGLASNTSRLLRVGTFETFSGYASQHLMTVLPPDWSLEMHELVPGQMEEALREHRVDVGITYQPVAFVGLKYQKVLSAQMGVYGSSLWTKTSLEELPFVAPLSTVVKGVSRAKGLDGWDEVAYPRKIQYRVDLLGTALQIASSAKAVIFIPHFLAKIYNEQNLLARRLHLVNLKVPRRMGVQDVFVVSRENEGDSPQVRSVAKFLRRLKDS